MVCQIRMPDCDHAQNSGTFCLTCKRKAVLICQNDLSGKFCHSRSLLLLAAARVALIRSKTSSASRFSAVPLYTVRVRGTIASEESLGSVWMLLPEGFYIPDKFPASTGIPSSSIRFAIRSAAFSPSSEPV